MKKLPVYKLRINEEDENLQVEYIALVEEPAIMSNWIAFDKQKQWFTVSEERHLLMGPAMIANMPIYRSANDKMDEHYVIFDKEEIMKIVQKYFRNGLGSNFNIEHKSGNKIKDIYVVESFVIDSSRGVLPPKQFEGISEGSWIITIKVDNEDVWRHYIQTGKLLGFSVEGMFLYEDFVESDEDLLNEVIRIVKNNS